MGTPACEMVSSVWIKFVPEKGTFGVKATTFFNDPKVVGDASRGLGEAMVGINVAVLPAPHRLSERGW